MKSFDDFILKESNKFVSDSCVLLYNSQIFRFENEWEFKFLIDGKLVSEFGFQVLIGGKLVSDFPVLFLFLLESGFQVLIDGKLVSDFTVLFLLLLESVFKIKLVLQVWSTE